MIISARNMALKFAKLGLPIVILRPRSKQPLKKGGVHSATTDRQSIRDDFEVHTESNYGIATGSASGIVVIDVDGPDGRESLRSLQSKHGRFPRTVTVQTARGRHYYFRSKNMPVRCSAGALGAGLDVRGHGGYIVGPGSRHPSGTIYDFVEGRGIADVEIAPAPKWLLDRVIKPRANDNKGTSVEIPAHLLERAQAYADAAYARELERLAKAPIHQRNVTLNRCAFRIGQFLAYGLVNKRSANEELTRAALQLGLEPAEVSATIESGLQTGLSSPRQLPFLKTKNQTSADIDDPPKPSHAKTLSRLGETDTDNAQRFATRWGHVVIYTRGRGWLAFDGNRFQPDAELRVVEMAKKTARSISKEARHLNDDEKKASRKRFSQLSLSKAALDRMIDLAKSLVAVEDEKLDADPWLLNTTAGTIDLRTGRREQHDARDLLTKLAPVAADRHAECPTFKKFLRRVTGGDPELMRYIQKCIGYSLTGDAREQVFFFCYGASGNNGKSTLLNLVRDMVGDYGRHTPTETLMVKQYDNNIPTDLARLAGVRMVTAVETNSNRQLDEAKIKAMTGGENITARFMRQDYFEFRPEFKLWFAANDRPRVRGTDTALWRRIRVIPFNEKIPNSEVEKDLPAKLKKELPGILAWAVRGCLAWQKEGLNEPLAVRRANRQWLQDADHLKRFLDEMVIIAPKHTVSASSLFDAYELWCRQNGETSHNQIRFKKVLQESFDFTHKRTKRGSDWLDVKLRLS